MSKRLKVKITLNSLARAEAIATRKLRGIETPEDFEGPVFEDVASVDGGEGMCVVQLNPNSEGNRVSYSYPLSSIARIATYEIDDV